MNNLSIRRSSFDDIPQLQKIFAYARHFMAETGNSQQWIASYPSDELLQMDIEKGNSYVVEQENEVLQHLF